MKVSIITATYNSESNIVHCLQSILNQTYSDFEVIIVDGDSNDNTVQLVKDTIGDKINFSLISEKDEGIYDALNKGINCSSGDIIGFLHSDDFFPNNDVLKNIVHSIKINDSHGVYSNLNYVHKKNIRKVIRKWTSQKYNRKKLIYGWMAPHPALYLKKQVYESLGIFDIRYRISADYDFMIKLFKSDFKIVYVNKTFVHMRMGGISNRDFKSLMEKFTEDYAVISNHNLMGLFTLLLKNLRKLNQFFY